MVAAITKVRLLRTGSLKGGYDTLASEDQYLLRVNEQVTKEAMIDLWLAVSPALPIPKATIKAVGGGYALCDEIGFQVHSKARYLWDATVSWKNIEENKPQPQTVPGPTGSTMTPTDWLPVVTRRPIAITEPLETAYYEGGFSGTTHTRLNANATATPAVRSMVCNSAMKPYQTNLPMKRRRQSLISIRWVRPASGAFPGNMLAYEGKLNSITKTFAFRGLSITMAAKTSLIESIQLTPVKIGNDWMWEINMEIIHDENGHLYSILDTGFSERFFTGETLPSGSAASAIVDLDIRDENGRIVHEATALNGAGKKGWADAPFYGKWRDQDIVDFDSIPLLQDLVS